MNDCLTAELFGPSSPGRAAVVSRGTLEVKTLLLSDEARRSLELSDKARRSIEVRRDREARDAFWTRVWALVHERTRRSMKAMRDWGRP